MRRSETCYSEVIDPTSVGHEEVTLNVRAAVHDLCEPREVVLRERYGWLVMIVQGLPVITSYSIHYTKLYELALLGLGLVAGARRRR